MKKPILLLLLLLPACLILACESSVNQNEVVEVLARDYKFEVTDSIPSGWTTFQFNNVGHAEHFFLLNLLPYSKSFEEYRLQVTGPFQEVFDSLKAGKSKEEAVALLVDKIPEWYFTDVKQMGGTGIVSKGNTTTVSLNLPPGTYAMECYIKEKGVFHTELGMINPLIVTKEKSDATPPEVNMDVTLSNFKYETSGVMKKGLNSIAVHFKEHPEYGLGNDLHIIRIDEQTDLDEVAEWLDWMNIEGLQSPAPVEFFGGTQEAPVGATTCFSVNLEPGDYALIAESSARKGMIHRFTIE